MAHVIPAIKGKMGNTEYYETTMPARELAMVARPASEMDAWAGWSIEERLQRELNDKRIEEQIVPYLAKAPDRFWGSVLVVVYEGVITFESISTVGAKVPAAYKSVAENIGFVTIEGGELILLDGQHRVVALRKIIQGKSKVQGDYTAAVPNDEISVIFIPYEGAEKTRRIFNKVNRNAKPTSRSDNIITSEDDGYAIVTRWLLDPDRGGPLGVTADGTELVNWKHNTIPVRSLQITTISAVYETVKDILECEEITHFDEKHRVTRPSDEELDHAYSIAKHWWETVLVNMPPFQAALALPSSVPDARQPEQPNSLLFKPVGQIALFKGLVRALQRAKNKGATFGLEKAVERAAKVPWSIQSPLWRDVLVRASGAVTARKEAYDLGANLIAYLIAPEHTTSDEEKELWRSYNMARGVDIEDADSGEPEDLPKPLT